MMAMFNKLMEKQNSQSNVYMLKKQQEEAAQFKIQQQKQQMALIAQR